MSVKQQLTGLRSRLRIDAEEARRSGAAYAGAGIIGLMKKGGQMERLPDVFGLPKTVGVALACKLGANYMSGATADYLNGVGDSAAVIAIYEFSQGIDVTGMAATGRNAGTTARELESRLRDRLTDDELADLVDELQGVDD
jgi:hypothetical protein